MDPLIRIERFGVLLDANLLLLLVLSGFDATLVGRGRLGAFTPHDVTLLEMLVAAAPRRLTTPHVLTEVSNLLTSDLPAKRRWAGLHYLRGHVDVLDERYLPANRICEATDVFASLGLTDAGVCCLDAEGALTLSVDARLVVQMQMRGLAAENFNRMRGL